MATFGENLKQIRNSKNISQGQLAELVNMHSTHISRYERNLTSPTVEVVKKIAEKLEVTTDQLIYGSHDDKAKENINDNELLKMFTKVQELGVKEIDCIKSLLNAYIFQKETQQRLVHQ
jgi:transcriptional regulator with XRE-family HTH domain